MPKLRDLLQLRRRALPLRAARSPSAAPGRPEPCACRFPSSAFASRFASARVAATTACSSRRSAVSPAPARPAGRRSSRCASCTRQRGCGARAPAARCPPAPRRRRRTRPRRARRCGARAAAQRGPESEPLPSSMPRGDRRRGSTTGRRRASAAARAGAPPAETTPASRRTRARGAVDLDVELVARRLVEGASGGRCGSRSGRRSSRRSANARRAAAALDEVEVDGQLAVPAQMPRTGGVEERRELGEPAAAPPRRDRRQLVAQVARRTTARSRRAPAVAACSRPRASHRSRARPRRRRGGTGRRARAGSGRRTSRPRGRRRAVRRAPPARRR